MPETSSAPVPTRPDPGPTTVGAPIEEEPEIKLPKIPEFTLLPKPPGNQHGNQQQKDNPFVRLEKTVNHIQSCGIIFLTLLEDRRTLAKKLFNACRIWRDFEGSSESHA